MGVEFSGFGCHFEGGTTEKSPENESLHSGGSSRQSFLPGGCLSRSSFDMTGGAVWLLAFGRWLLLPHPLPSPKGREPPSDKGRG